jgi:hypothetical protein
MLNSKAIVMKIGMIIEPGFEVEKNHYIHFLRKFLILNFCQFAELSV